MKSAESLVMDLVAQLSTRILKESVSKLVGEQAPALDLKA